MRRPFKITGIALILGLLLIQFLQPERNRGSNDPGIDFIGVTSVPDSLAKIFQHSCYDCHSNLTRYPWYSYVAPVSWFLESHIREGKEKMNLADFGSFDQQKKIGILVDICEAVEDGSMPLKSYLLIHGDAAIDQSEMEAICNWTELEALRLMRN